MNSKNNLLPNMKCYQCIKCMLSSKRVKSLTIKINSITIKNKKYVIFFQNVFLQRLNMVYKRNIFGKNYTIMLYCNIS